MDNDLAHLKKKIDEGESANPDGSQVAAAAV